jgi:hypothetical protein
MKFGFPGLDTLRSFDDYVLSYDRRNRVPHWVFEHLTKEALVYNESIDRKHCEFIEDASMHPYFRYIQGQSVLLYLTGLPTSGKSIVIMISHGHRSTNIG